MNWIDIQTGPKPRYGEFVIFKNGTDYGIGKLYVIENYKDYSRYVFVVDEFSDERLEVTHWMPLLELPKI